MELREYRERETEVELGRAIGALQALENRLAEVGNELSQAAAERFAPDHTFLVIQDYDLFILRLETTRDQLLKEAAQAAARVEAARAIYLEASRDRKALDKLKEMRRKEYRREVFAAETRERDDLAGGLTARKVSARVEQETAF